MIDVDQTVPVRRYRHTNPLSWAWSLLRERARYADWSSWLVNVRNRLRMLWSGSKPGRKPIRAVRVKGFDEPFYVRVGSSDLYMLDEVILGGEYEAVTKGELGDVRRIVDLGANAGMSVRLWQHRWPGAQIVAVEPDPNNLEVCRLNAEADNGGGTVALLQACVAARPRRVTVEHRVHEAMYRMRDAREGEPTVEAIRFVDVLERGAIDGDVDLLKVDIEGAEREVFQNCEDWIDRVRHMVVETDLPYTAEDLLQDVRRCGGKFRMVSVARNASNNVALLSRLADV